jgi:D-alanine-D-alanine ligase
MTTERVKVAVVAGGDSGEYEISMQSGWVVYKHLDRKFFEPYLVEIQGGRWICVSQGNSPVHIDKNDFSMELAGEKILFDIVFNAIHGTPGENGKLQGYLDMLGIPYTSCDVTTSALTFNKYMCNRVVASFGIPVADSIVLHKDQFDTKMLDTGIGYPCFVKPNSGGSSVGISKVTEKSGVLPAIKKAFLEDDQVMVESFIQGREITCGVIKIDGSVQSLPVTEVISKKEFFDYEAKYTKGMADEITPAEIDDIVEKECRRISEMLYEKLNCKGIVRFDYILEDDKLWFLEVNTIPGLTDASIVPKQALSFGFSLEQLFTYAIKAALGN